MWNYVKQVLIAFDQLLTALVGGWADETLSSYAWRMYRDGKPWGRFWKPVIDWLALTFFGQSDHCWKAFVEEQFRRQLPPEFR